MTRLLVEVEGETEEDFVNDVLAGHLCSVSVGYKVVSARLLGKSRHRKQRGGIKEWDIVRKGILDHLKQDPEVIVTTIVDYYGLPGTWPGWVDASSGRKCASERASIIEEALSRDVSSKLQNFDPRRFVPYVEMHEFEALLFSDTDQFALSIGRPDLSSEFRAIRNKFHTPEEINDSPETHPSKRIRALFPRYQKRLMGVDAAKKIGLDTIRKECPAFRRWMEKLESLA